METIETELGALEGWSVGSGQPVLTIHGAVIADAFRCLERQPVLADAYRLIGYHRRGFGGSADHDGPFTIYQQAADASAVLRHFEVDRGHVVGHSYGGAIALQLALDEPDAVGSLAVLEPAIAVGPAAMEPGNDFEGVEALWMSGDKPNATRAFLEAVAGPGWREAVDQTVGGRWFDEAARVIDVLFEIEGPGSQAWSFGVAEAGRLRGPCLAVCGDRSIELFQEGFRWLQDHVDGLETLWVPGATHLLQMQQPEAIAAGLAAFLSRHPLDG